jgi:Na+-translocating ferredoxin:NAD+ oxidoreductase subunit D
MSIIASTSPHTHNTTSTNVVMREVLLATLPGLLALSYHFGWGTVLNVLWASVTCLLTEAIVLACRNRPIMYYLNDGSALVTAVLLGISLPPFAPWWLIVLGSFFAIALVKHLYGGLGYNPFNPAMASYVFLLISFPLPMTTWGIPGEISAYPGLIDTVLLKLSSLPIPDAYTMATPLDIVRQNLNEANGFSWRELKTIKPQFDNWGGLGWQTANAGFLLGGIYLLCRKIFTWHAPISMLLTLSVLSIVFFDQGSSRSIGSPLFQLFTGATMFGAFFIITDPVSSAVSNRGRMVFGALVGVLIFIIRRWGNYPDAVAFSVLLVNFAAPLIDHYTVTRTYGHKQELKRKE